MDNYKEKQMKDIGPGGFKCSCCNPFNNKDRSMLNKRARARLRAEDEKEFNKTLTPQTREEILNEIMDEDIDVFWDEYQQEIYDEYFWWRG